MAKYKHILIASIIFSCASLVFWETKKFSNKIPAAYGKALLIYYANETVLDESSNNELAEFISRLRSIESKIGSEIANELESEGDLFRSVVSEETSQLSQIFNIDRFNLAIFTNRDILEGRYKLNNKILPARGFPSDRLSNYGSLLQSSPLSSKEALAWALLTAISNSDRPSSVFIIINSHGSKEYALKPRVGFDVSRVDKEMIANIFSRSSEDPLPASVELIGTTKYELWDVLRAISQSTGVVFPLVVLDSCESAARGWDDYINIPISVSYVAHSGRNKVRLKALPYSRINVDQKNDKLELSSLLIDFFSRADFYIQSQLLLWIWPFYTSLELIPIAFFFVPISLMFIFYFKIIFR